MAFSKRIIKITLLTLLHAVSTVSFSQSFSVDELIRFPHLSSERLSDSLESRGWKKKSFEFIADSHYVRHSWVVPNKYNDLKSYVLLYDFVNDTSENYLVFQFSNPKAFSEYKTLFKKTGFKELTQKSKGKKKKRKNQKNIYEETEEIYYNEKFRSVIKIKEFFVYGMFSYLISSYNAYSAIGKNILQETGNKIPNIQD